MSSRAPGERREAMREALIESRLTPNAISLTGFALCLVAAGLIFADMIVLGGIAYIIGSICDTLDGRYSRMSGKGSPFGAFLDSTLDRVEEGVVLAAVAYNFAQQGKGVEDRIGILWDQVGPAAPVVWVDQGQSGAWCVEIRRHVDAAVTTEVDRRLGVDVALHQGEGGLLGRALLQVCDPEVIARLGSL